MGMLTTSLSLTAKNEREIESKADVTLVRIVTWLKEHGLLQRKRRPCFLLVRKNVDLLRFKLKVWMSSFKMS